MKSIKQHINESKQINEAVDYKKGKMYKLGKTEAVGMNSVFDYTNTKHKGNLALDSKSFKIPVDSIISIVKEIDSSTYIINIVRSSNDMYAGSQVVARLMPLSLGFAEETTINESKQINESADPKVGDMVEVRSQHLMKGKGQNPWEVLDTGKFQAVSTYAKTTELHKHYKDEDEDDQPYPNDVTFKVNGHWYIEDDVVYLVKI